MKTWIIAAYLSVIHFLLIVLLIFHNPFGTERDSETTIINSSGELSSYFHKVVGYHKRMDGNVPTNAVIFIGDSITQGLNTSAITEPTANYGIGGDTTVGIIERLNTYQSINNARAVVIAIGINDIKYRENDIILNNYKTIIGMIPSHVPIVISAVHPIDERVRNDANGFNESRIKPLNKELKNYSLNSERLFYVDTTDQLIDSSGNLDPKYHDLDGVHLNSEGNAVWIQNLRIIITQLDARAL